MTESGIVDSIIFESTFPIFILNTVRYCTSIRTLVFNLVVVINLFVFFNLQYSFSKKGREMFI